MNGEASANRNQLVLIGCAAGVIVGSLGPWATVWIISINGTDGDGVFTLVAGAIAGLLALLEYKRPNPDRRRYAGMMVLFIGCAGLGAFHWANVEDLASRSDFPTQVGWGLPLLTIAAAIGALVALVELGEINRCNPVEPNDGPSEPDRSGKSYWRLAIVVIGVSTLIVVWVLEVRSEKYESRLSN